MRTVSRGVPSLSLHFYSLYLVARNFLSHTSPRYTLTLVAHQFSLHTIPGGIRWKILVKPASIYFLRYRAWISVILRRQLPARRLHFFQPLLKVFLFSVISSFKRDVIRTTERKLSREHNGPQEGMNWRVGRELAGRKDWRKQFRGIRWHFVQNCCWSSKEWKRGEHSCTNESLNVVWSCSPHTFPPREPCLSNLTFWHIMWSGLKAWNVVNKSE